MQFNPITLAATIVGGLVVAALLAWIRKPRLVVLVPRSFSYSQISERGQLIEISIFNRGFKTEETVDISLNPNLRYELVGSNDQDAKVTGSKVQIPRIGPADEVTVLLLVEPGTFKRDDIAQCLSKETKGSIVGKLEDVPPTGTQRIAILGMFVLAPAVLYGMNFAIDFGFKLFKPTPVSTYTSNRNLPLDVRGWKIPWYQISSSTLTEPFKQEKIKIDIGEIVRRGDLATIPVSVSNLTAEVLKFRINMISAHSEKRFKSYELSAEVPALSPARTEVRRIQVVIPQSASSVSERTAFIEVRVENMYGQSLTLHTEREIK